MNKGLKIVLYGMLSFVGVIIVAAVIAVSLVTSSEKLTQLVKKYAPDFVTCKVELGKADLTILKTFPNVGVAIDNVALINPMDGSPSDTVANIDRLIVSLDVKRLLKSNEIVIRKCVVEDAFVNVYTDGNGLSNLDIFKTSGEKDTVSSNYGYLVDVESVKIKNSEVYYVDSLSGLAAHVSALDLDLKGGMRDRDADVALDLKMGELSVDKNKIRIASSGFSVVLKGSVKNYNDIDGVLQLASPDFSISFGDEYLTHDALGLKLPLEFSLDNRSGSLKEAQIALNDYLVNLTGELGLAENGDVNMDLCLNTNTLVLEDLINYLPKNVYNSLAGLKPAGRLSIVEAQIKGTYNDSLMPVVTARLAAHDASAEISGLPYPLQGIEMQGNLDLNLNEKSNLEITTLSATMHDTRLNGRCYIYDLTDDLTLDIAAKADLPLTDVKRYLPKNMFLNGRSEITLDARFTLDELMKTLKDYNVNRLHADGKMKIKGFAFGMKDINAASRRLDVEITLPASRRVKGRKGAYLSVAGDNLKASMDKDDTLEMNGFILDVTADDFASGIEKMKLDANLSAALLDGRYDTIRLHSVAPVVVATTLPGGVKQQGVKGRISLGMKGMEARMGESYALNTETLKIVAGACQDKTKEDFLNQWNPEADFSVANAEVHIDGVDETLYVPNIDFLFNSHELGFKKSTVRIGQSDLSLEGNVVGIKEWIEDHGNLMKGEMQVTSDFLNINEIMDLVSGLGSDADTLAMEEVENKEDNPFIVPKGIDFYFGIKTKRAVYDNFDLNNLGGQMTLKDGVIVLREIGFTNKAAEMQLTAMYRSQRKNHLFLGMDFHLLDVQINDLLTMIPYVDTLVPMLSTFDGQAEFHIAAESYLKSNYKPKVSTLRAAADIEGQNLYVKDKTTLAKITDMLDVSANGEYKIDSLDVQLTVFKDQVDLYPFMISIGKYKAVASGRQNLDRTCSYHISVTDSPLPTRLGLDVTGSLGNLKFSMAPCRYKNLYRPERRNDTDNMTIELKRKIAEALKDNVQ